MNSEIFNNTTTPPKNQLYSLCTPALIYLIFSLSQIIIDTFKGLHIIAFFKFITMIIFTLLLNGLCSAGLGIVSWVIVFIPFMLMTVITSILIYIFGLDPITGRLKYIKKNKYIKTHPKEHKSLHPYKNTKYNPPKPRQYKSKCKKYNWDDWNDYSNYWSTSYHNYYK